MFYEIFLPLIKSFYVSLPLSITLYNLQKDIITSVFTFLIGMIIFTLSETYSNNKEMFKQQIKNEAES